ncbi:tumor protein p53-inducible nuclear protein 2 [Athalia rosae]|uniref:tumor protein p53-inducible nuclear protein 2 n=1 Tax=Athalia rosae TaxID=37344 RepID=UPI000626CC59|nr:tumor protein p53-inducible nuclear protein 2 [Athalia rosae]XP_012260716.1 tumor protein p53-inducible nuclear protein 2 [Athalia rosae]XP_012260717.1 tumor protein p53-inducible nuclear protein 2 [Athalia rosae]
MLSSLANYLLGGSPSAQEVRGDNRQDEPLPVETRLNQVEVEGDDWILIDRAVEGTTALEESWYVTPPACFTKAGPIHVETSPLEDLLIEHPSMSVYRAAAPLVTPDTPPPTPDTPTESESIPIIINEKPTEDAPRQRQATPRQRHNNRREQQQLQGNPQRRNNNNINNNNGVRERRPAREEEAQCVQLRAAQKVLEQRAAQAIKRGRLERGNKVREVASGKGKRPRRQDRLRLQNSGANNNRKC